MQKKHFIFLSLIAISGACRADWQSQLQARRVHMGEQACALLQSQYHAFTDNEAPKIADPVIKAISIEECGEILVNINESNAARIAMLPNPSHPFASPDCNSGFPAACKIRKTVFDKVCAMISHIDKLALYFGYKAGAIHIKVFEGLRDLKTQETIFINKMRQIQQATPAMTDEQAYAETCKWVSPIQNNIPVHSTGGAIDVRLWNSETEQFLDMGMFGVIWGKNSSAPTFSQDLTEVQINNRLLLLTAAAQAGLVNYAYEWWHFSSGDRYASYWQDADDLRKAIYGVVQNYE